MTRFWVICLAKGVLKTATYFSPEKGMVAFTAELFDAFEFKSKAAAQRAKKEILEGIKEDDIREAMNRFMTIEEHSIGDFRN